MSMKIQSIMKNKFNSMKNNYNLIKQSELFDLNFYSSEANMNFKSYDEGLSHYLEIGYKKGYNPSPKFNGNNYLKKYPDIKKAQINPLIHYIKYGKKEKRTDTIDLTLNELNLINKLELFDLEYYNNFSKKTFKTYEDGLIHYLEIGYKKGYNPSPKFNGNNYLKKYPDIKKAQINPLIHYIKYGKKEKRTDTIDKNIKEFELVKKSKIFDLIYYNKESNFDFKGQRRALMHYLEIGYKNGYNPSEKFNGNIYLKKYPEVSEKEYNPLVHYLKYGKKEGKTAICDKNLKEYKLIKNSKLFDWKYYVNEYELDLNNKHDSLIHYLEIGYKKGFNPSKKFNNNDYLKRYPEVKKAKFNPLVHYLKFGINENRFGIKQKEYVNFKDNYDIKNVFEKINQKVSIIIQVNNPNNIEKCIENIYNTSKNFKIILLTAEDSHSELNYYYNKNQDIEIINNINTHEKFIDYLNDFINKTENDIIFLKDNIKTYKNWIKKLIMATYSNDRIGFTAPISNFAPISLVNLPDNEKSARIIANISEKKYNETALPNDICVYIKSEVFKGINFNEESSEKNWLNDFIEKSCEKGWRLIFDDSTYVYYESEKQNTQKDKYDLSTPYFFKNQPNPEFVNSNAFKSSYNNLKYYSKYDLDNESKKNILYAMHYSGGVDLTVKDIAKSINDRYNCYILKSFKDCLRLYEVYDNETMLISQFDLKYPWHAKMIHHEEFAQIYFYILINYNIDLVEIDHLLLQPFDLPYIAKSLNIPTILTLHDFYYICPTYFLLDENNEYCGGYCGDKPRNCSVRTQWFDLPANIVEWKKEWQTHVLDLFDTCDAIVTATSFTKDMFLEHYPILSQNNIKLIEHGRDLIRYDNLNTVPNKYQPIKILIPGTIGPHKGQEFIKKLKEIDEENRLEFHYIGYVDEDLASIGKFHGSYKREDFSKEVFKIKPSFIGIFSVCAETYSHTLTEAISSGVPVLASNLGALKTRIESDGGGWLIDIHNPKKTYAQILKLAESKQEYKTVTNNLKNIKIKTTKEMSDEYEKLYSELIEKYD